MAFLLISLSVIALRCLPPKPDLFAQYGFSSAVYDRHDRLLKITLSPDDKYRLFVPFDKIPVEAIDALILYEDRAFFYHFGINPLRVILAAAQMVSGGRKQGASTISMQLARIVYHIDSSHLSGKIEQMLRAIQIEFFYSKNEILEAYFNLAPYGGNIEGIAAASQIYFGKDVSKLRLAEILTLTVIPQNPSGRNLLTTQKKNEAIKASERLKKIWLQKFPSHQENESTMLPLASGIFLPQEAMHFTRRLTEKNNGQIYTTLDLDIQHMAEESLREYINENRHRGVLNATVLIVDAHHMNTLAYIGSADFFNNSILGQVDGIKALRSPGSALKPFIYAKAIEKGIIHPKTMLKDVPRHYGTYTPENFDQGYFGMLNATDALVRSRNIPAVDLLYKIGEPEFHHFLQQCDIPKLRSPEFYGLAMALGGTEVSMQNLAEMYAMLYNNGQFQKLRFEKNATSSTQQLILPEAAFLTRYMLAQNLPTDQNNQLPYSPKGAADTVSWKTGTSYGYKDAWSVGIAGHYIVGVWVGNFDGTPNSSFIGREIAAPLFFRLVRKLKKIEKNEAELTPPSALNLAKVKICSDTGDIANEQCDRQEETYFIPGITQIKISNITRKIPIDIKTGLRACRHTPPSTELKSFNFWPSDVLKAYADAGINFRQPPAFKEPCTKIETGYLGKAPQIIFPVDGSRIYLRPEQDNNASLALKATVDSDAENIFWFVDDRLIGNSSSDTVLEIAVPIGFHEVKAVDNLGRFSKSTIHVLWPN